MHTILELFYHPDHLIHMWWFPLDFVILCFLIGLFQLCFFGHILRYLNINHFVWLCFTCISHAIGLLLLSDAFFTEIKVQHIEMHRSQLYTDEFWLVWFYVITEHHNHVHLLAYWSPPKGQVLISFLSQWINLACSQNWDK